jgi:nucleotide-binding universal stress UspA family protein
MKKILIPVDETRGSKEALALFSTAVTPAEEVILLHVPRMQGGSLMIDMLSDAEIETLKESMEGTAHKDSLDRKAEKILGFYRAKVEERTSGTVKTMVREGIVSDVILKVAREEDVDMIIMGCSGKSGFDRLISGCATNEVERLAEVPVLVAKNDGCQKHVYGWSEVYAAQ